MSQMYHVRKNQEQSVFQSHSTFDVASVQKKLVKHAQRQHINATYTIDPPVCLDCECPILFSGIAGYVCQCEPD